MLWSLSSNRVQRFRYLTPGAWPLVLLTVSLANAAILPDQFGGFMKGSSQPLAASDPALFQEFGFQAGERAEYKSPQKRFSVSAWRFQDSTGALALFEARRPALATPGKLTDLFVKTPDGAVVGFANYVFQITGAVPEQKDLELLYVQLPQLDRAPLPALISYLPQEGLIPNSERYILGPASLARYEPRISPSLAAFHLGAEAQTGRYRTPKGDLNLVIFSYPTPNMARERQEELLKVPGTIAKRSGPLVGVVVQPPDADAAEQVLAQVQYAGKLTLNQQVPVNQAQYLAKLFLNIFTLSGVLMALSIIVGVGFGGFRVLLRKLGRGGDEEPFVLLRIRDNKP
jgi:hypothetical protein